MATPTTCLSRLSLLIPLSPPILHRFLAPSLHQSLSSLPTSGLRDASLQLGARLHLDVRLFEMYANADPTGHMESMPISIAHELRKVGHRYLDVK